MRKVSLTCKASSFMFILLTNLKQSCEKIFASDFDWLTSSDGGNTTFDSATEAVKSTGNSLYKLLMAIAVVGLVVSIITCGISMSINKNATKKAENKSHMVDIAIGGIVIFGAMFIISLIKSIGEGL